MAHLYLVRHAESEMNLRSDLVGGRSNHVHLTERGVRQAKAFGKWMRNYRLLPDVVYTSPAVRTMDTMQHSMEAAGFNNDDYVVDPRIQELAQGIKEGTPRAEAYTEGVLAQIAEQQLDFKFEGGESINDVMQRMGAFVTDIAWRYPDGGNIVAYTHGFSIRCLVGAINNLSHHKIVKGIDTPNVSLSALFVSPEFNHVRYVGQRVIDEESV